MRQRLSFTVIAFAVFVMGGCAHKTHHPQDPFEGINRGVYKFNKTADKLIIKPVSYIYWKYMPQPIQTGVGNFFDNLSEIPHTINEILQANFRYVAWDMSRFLINSTVGVAGFFDIAGALGVEQHKNDFGQTLYKWGYKESAYLVIPLLGPSTFRDGIGLAMDYTILSVWPWVESHLRYKLLVLDALDTRARLLRSETVLEAVAIDEYEFIRNAYFQRRAFVFNQGNDLTNETDPYDEGSDIPTS